MRLFYAARAICPQQCFEHGKLAAKLCPSGGCPGSSGLQPSRRGSGSICPAEHGQKGSLEGKARAGGDPRAAKPRPLQQQLSLSPNLPPKPPQPLASKGRVLPQGSLGSPLPPRAHPGFPEDVLGLLQSIHRQAGWVLPAPRPGTGWLPVPPRHGRGTSPNRR